MNPLVDLLDEVTDFVASSLGFTAGQNIFVGQLPEPGMNGVAPLSGVYLVELPGPMPDQYLDTETHVFDIWSSSTDSLKAKQSLRQVYDLLHRNLHWTTTNWLVYFSYANSTIKDEGRGREGNKLFSLSVSLICRNLNNLS